MTSDNRQQDRSGPHEENGDECGERGDAGADAAQEPVAVGAKWALAGSGRGDCEQAGGRHRHIFWGKRRYHLSRAARARGSAKRRFSFVGELWIIAATPRGVSLA
jgi:hypothetical protein